MDTEHLDTGPEVYETSDVESVENILPPEELSEEVDRKHLDSESAKSRFEMNVISDTIEVTDFLDSLTSGLNGYNVYKAKETRPQKLARIQAELEELRTEKLDSTEIDSLTHVLEQLVEHAEPSKNIHSEELRAVFSKIDIAVSSRNTPEVISRSTETDAAVLEFEKRLLSLEEAVGISDLQSTKSVRNHINDLSRKVEVLYDPEVDLVHIKSEIKKLTKEIDELNTKRRIAHLHSDVPVTSTTPFEAKVDTVFNMVPELDKSAAVVPHLVSRLRSLHHVHADLANSVSFVSTLDKTVNNMEQEMRNWNDTLDEVNNALDAHRELFEKNKLTVEQRLADFEKRFGVL